MRLLVLGCVAALLVSGLDARKLNKKFKTCPGSAGCKEVAFPGTVSSKVISYSATGSWKQYPYLVAFQSQAALDAQPPVESAYCTGVLINNQWVLTAAYCVTNGVALNYYKPGALWLQTNALPTPTGPGLDGLKRTVVTTSDIYWPSEYQGGLNANIGLVKLDAPVTNSFSIAPLADVGVAAGLANNYALGIAGFGVTAFDPSYAAGLNGLLNNPIADSDAVRVGTVALAKASSQGTYLALGNTPTSAACAGDWGAPAMQWSSNVDAQRLVALFVSGGKCDPAAISPPLGYYTDITNKAIRDWVNAILARNGAGPV